ncbi:MAG: hypothetical protein KDD48_08235, partial [Bdellovibrionales bacterium]|nr:hypothetical protein [Bdellovibrionales bacterium]
MSREMTENLSQPVSTLDDLLIPFNVGSRPSSEFKIGLETEKIGIRGHQPLLFDGPFGLEMILESFAKRYEWKRIYDHGKIIALEKGQMAVTIEPGGQLELSGEQLRTVEQVHSELSEHLIELKSISDGYGVRWISAGIHPFCELDAIPWVPKTRYALMRKYYQDKSGMAHQMMKMTASSQINLDYSNEIDAKKKLRIGAALGPIVGAMMANSAYEAGSFNGYCSRRIEIWEHTDSDRCGIKPFFVDGT